MKLRTHSYLQRLFVRVSFAWVLYALLPGSLKYHQQLAPNGVARFVDLTVLAAPAVYTALKWGAFACLLAFAAGVACRVAMVYLTLLVVVIGTLSNSQGAIDHGYNGVALTLLGHCLGYLFFPAWRRLHDKPSDAHPDDLAFNFSMQFLGCVYVIAGITKLRLTDGAWIQRTPYLAVDIVKANAQAHYNYFDPERLEFGQKAAEFIVDHALLWQVLFGAGLVLELLALLALKSRTWALVIGLNLYALHESVYHLMRLSFTYNKHMLLIFFIGAPLFAADAVEWAYRRWRPVAA